MEAHVLDNPIWHMLCHDLADVTTGTEFAKRSHPDIGPFSAVANHSARAFEDVAKLFNTDEGVGIFEVKPPQEISGFKAEGSFSADQMVCQKRILVPEYEVELIELRQSDLEDVQQLIEMTNSYPIFPGLFVRRRFVGIRQDGQLVAMAGTRIEVPGFSEISAVCTHPDWRGHGYGTLLTQIIAAGMWERGQTPFLHVDSQNISAYRIYEGLHFVKRTEITAVLLTRL
jgi:ribosomal protein S18 acetylase RimI-like enzyme